MITCVHSEEFTEQLQLCQEFCIAIGQPNFLSVRHEFKEDGTILGRWEIGGNKLNWLFGQIIHPPRANDSSSNGHSLLAHEVEYLCNYDQINRLLNSAPWK